MVIPFHQDETASTETMLDKRMKPQTWDHGMGVFNIRGKGRDAFSLFIVHHPVSIAYVQSPKASNLLFRLYRRN